MFLNAKTEYACLAMLQLALEHRSGEPVQIGRIAQRHGIPKRFLVQILLQLKQTGLVISLRGASGGYRLGRPPEQISLADVLAVMDGHRDWNPSSTAGSELTHILGDLCVDLADARHQELSAITLTSLVEQIAVEAAPDWCI